MIYHVTHVTRYRYGSRVSICQNLACLEPRETPNQRCLKFLPRIFPEPTHKKKIRDYFGNSLLWFSFQEGYKELNVTSVSQVEVNAPRVPPVEQSPPWEEILTTLKNPATEEQVYASQFRYESPRVRVNPQFQDYARESFTPGRPILEAIQCLTHRIHTGFEFNDNETDVTTPVEEVFRKRKGVCQDFTHVQLSMLRSLGLSARYVSGYIRTFPPEGQERLAGADATHAWTSVWSGESGWIDTDPTNDKFLSEDHITVAWARDYSEVAPLRGVYTGGGQSTLSVEVNVVPVEG